ncbi:ATP-dependent Clp protease ATP-binding subunit ClpA [candidate division KSB3 bacterium]|uniref:ATP-dependent Clp protease ATP-binding subunit ClpA n=1 Tax=candidate division KSB3 bacterium TaxID=2044937 RepID=A0A2G6E3T0_9BACT|nr:MAG: ATP-dependent Clp protease ATP-binding subunit ClpA [candidate division KSB3 bacterium]PIE29399.1 MAG: ATP-dependent Clp protease ATP-binding subunit ClpA [candidate division KSB3 bacterium]
MSHHDVQTVVDGAVREAILRRHEYITVEHLLYGIVQHEDGKTIIWGCGGDVNSLLQELLDFFHEQIPELPVPQKPLDDDSPEPELLSVQTLGFRRVLERAVNQVSSSGKAELEIGDLLAGIFLEQDSHAVYLLKKQGITRVDVLSWLSHGRIDSDDEWVKASGENSGELGEDDESDQRRATRSAAFQIESFAVDLTQLAKQDRLDPLIGRDRELRRIIQVLCRRLKHNPLLIGEPGVGKTAIVEGLAQKIVRNEVPKILRDAKIFAMDIGSLLAGTKFRGQFEQRLKGILTLIKQYNDNAPSGLGALLFVDEIHMIVGAGSTSGNSVDASGFLKRALHTDNLRCIGTTTHEEYRRHFEHDKALVRRFQKLDIAEASVDDSIAILKGLRPRFEDYHGVRYTDQALEGAARLSFQHIAERFLPDKAIDVIDEAGALNQIQDQASQKRTLDLDDIEDVLTEIANIPDLKAGESEREQLAELRKRMTRKVFGQDEAIEAVVSSIKLARAGLNLPDKPVGAFLFAGPTGVGKTEIAKQLALCLGLPFKRFDMSEYMEKHAVSRLIGAPPGYVGYDQGGLLTETIRKNPHCVLLLDEIEKAHIDLFDILLQVMDHAVLTDNSGREADFRHVVLLMTSNAGAREMDRRAIGFDRQIDDSAGRHAVEHLFSPEFRNRLTKIVYFHGLSQEIMENIVEKFIDELRGQLASQQIQITLEPDARSWLAEHGYDERYGARPLARLIQETIRQPLAEEILFGKLEHGGKALISQDGDDLKITAEGS